jgi:2-polyprenyl-3-methyl-5-hydroxy-6-metoxy-1,4-benzoquinol methylase
VPLHQTYNTTDIHQIWKEAYHPGGAQAAFDDIVYDWIFQDLKLPSTKWIDSGCGTGDLCFRLWSHGCEVLGVDISASAIEQAQKSAMKYPECASRVRFQQSSLEDLSPAIQGDHVHCRGVLMHIPDWSRSLKNLAMRLKPQGFFVVFESNAASIEGGIVRLVRMFRSNRSDLKKTADGWEFWGEYQGAPFLARMFHLDAIRKEMAKSGLKLVHERSLFVLDPLRAPSALRRSVAWLNRAWFSMNLPLASGVIQIYQKS